MKKTLLLSYACLLICFVASCAVQSAAKKSAASEPALPTAAYSTALPSTPLPTLSPSPMREAGIAATKAPETITLKQGDKLSSMKMQDYLVGVVAAEMPVSFDIEALKAQAVAARSYTLYCESCHRHEDATVCSSYACCQAFESDEELRASWGASYESYVKKIREAVDSTEGQYLIYEGAPVFAAFHSSSCGKTEDCGKVWNPMPYLISVSSPESAADVPEYISTVELSPIDFRDTLLRSKPQADFTGKEETWIGNIDTDGSGRVSSIVLGGVTFGGLQVRELFSLRSAAFTLSYANGIFRFTVTGFGHGVGMSQYGANAMAVSGSDYTQILAHYYPGTSLVS